jgi:hypothetical protein
MNALLLLVSDDSVSLRVMSNKILEIMTDTRFAGGVMLWLCPHGGEVKEGE